jgi:hypothetical protein
MSVHGARMVGRASSKTPEQPALPGHCKVSVEGLTAGHMMQRFALTMMLGGVLETHEHSYAIACGHEGDEGLRLIKTRQAHHGQIAYGSGPYCIARFCSCSRYMARTWFVCA